MDEYGGALLARAKDDETGAVAPEDKASLSNAAFGAVISRIKAGFAQFARGAITVAIKPVRGMKDLPTALRAAGRQQLGLGMGIFHDNIIYVVQKAHGTPEEVERRFFIN